MASPVVSPASPTSEDNGLDRDLMIVAWVVVLGAFMSILDVTVVNVAINTLAAEFDTTLPTIQWVSTGYTLALATVIPLTGWAADRFGTKRLYMTSIALFVAGSVLSGLAWSAGSIIFFRVLQGFGGGMLMPLGMTILTRAAGPQRVGRVMAIIGVPMLLGPILGGWLVDAYSWRYIFFINVPIGAAALVLSIRILQRDVPAPHHRLDWLRLAPLSPGLAAVIYAWPMVAMPIAGRLTDMTGVGRIVPVGLVIVAVSFLGLTQLEADTSYWLLGASSSSWGWA